MKKNIFFSFLSLFVTAFLLVLTLFGWYTSNSHVDADGIFGKTAGQDYQLHLERGEFAYTDDPQEDSDGWEWTWYTSDEMIHQMQFNDIQPGDAFFFRILIESSKDMEFSVELDGIKSALMENLLFAYINNNLLEYELTSDTEKQTGTDYYIGTFTLDSSVTVGYPIKSFTYYERKFNEVAEGATFILGRTYYEQENGGYILSTDKQFDENKTYYEAEYFLTSDTNFVNGKQYFKSRFILEEFPNFRRNQYYVIKQTAAVTSPNAVGYRYQAEPPAYNYLYPLYAGTGNTKVVKITDTKNLYNVVTTTTNGVTTTTVELANYKIEDVFKFHDIGVSYKKNANDIAYHELFSKTDRLYEYTFNELPKNAQTGLPVEQFDSNKKYYIKNQPLYNGDYVEYVGDSFVAGKTYYTKGDVVMQNNSPKALYANDFIKTASATFDTSLRLKEDGSESGVTYYYFALEFNEAASIEDIYGVLSSNCYLYQNLKITELRVQKVPESDD